MILGTAGHIDHGKTALVRALTGVDTDRLPEERRRGISIDLGFAPLVLDGVGTVGVVDVPGHEGLVRTMVAGATGIDAFLLVVAADEGVMPQTREHASILKLLGIRAGVVAVTKCDLVDDAWLELVRLDIMDLLGDSGIGDPPIVSVSARTGAGLAELKQTLAGMFLQRARSAASKNSHFFMPLDRSFSVRGTGTVVTGTVWSGAVEVGDNVRILPGDQLSRVRAIEQHGEQQAKAQTGARAALALADLDREDVARGQVVVRGDAWRASERMLVEFSLLPGARVAAHSRASLRFLHGTTDTAARLVARSTSDTENDRAGDDHSAVAATVGVARLLLATPVVARAGDRFVLRVASPPATIGGGVVVDPAPTARRCKPRHLGESPAMRLRNLLSDEHSVALNDVIQRCGDLDSVLHSQLCSEENHEFVLCDSRVYLRSELLRVTMMVSEAVAAWHLQFPAAAGMHLRDVGQLGQPRDAPLLDRAVSDLVESGSLLQSGGVLCLANFVPEVDVEEEVLRGRVLQLLLAGGREPRTVAELVSALGATISQQTSSDILAARVFSAVRKLEEQGLLIRIESERFYSAAVIEEMILEVRNLPEGREMSPGDFREVIGLSRKYLVPLLEYFDRLGVTERRQNGRVVRNR